MTTVEKAISVMTRNSTKQPRPGTTAAEALSGLPKAKGPARRTAAPKTAETPTKAPTDPTVRRTDPVAVKQVAKHDNEGESRLALRNSETGEFASAADARREPDKVVTDFVENPTGPRKAPAKKAPAKKAVAKKAPAKKAAKKVASKKK